MLPVFRPAYVAVLPSAGFIRDNQDFVPNPFLAVFHQALFQDLFRSAELVCAFIAFDKRKQNNLIRRYKQPPSGFSKIVHPADNNRNLSLIHI